MIIKGTVFKEPRNLFWRNTKHMDIIIFPEKKLRLLPVTTGSANIIHPLMLDCYPPVYQHLWEDLGQWYVDTTFSKAAVLDELQEKGAPYWIIEWKGKPAGVLRLVLDKACPDYLTILRQLKLHRIYLHPRTHRQGVGRILMDFVLKYTRQQNCQMIWLEAMDTQTDALLFYEKMGFETIGTFRLSFERMHTALRGMVRMIVKL